MSLKPAMDLKEITNALLAADAVLEAKRTDVLAKISHLRQADGERREAEMEFLRCKNMLLDVLKARSPGADIDNQVATAVAGFPVKG